MATELPQRASETLSHFDKGRLLPAQMGRHGGHPSQALEGDAPSAPILPAPERGGPIAFDRKIPLRIDTWVSGVL
jgi:hypothetical protein